MPQSRIIYISRASGRPRKKTGRKSRRLIFWAGVTFVIVIAAGLFVPRIPALQITEIHMSSVPSVDGAAARELAAAMLEGTRWGFLPNRFFLAVSEGMIASQLLNRFPRLDAVDVEVSFNHLEVILRERELFGVMCRGAVQEGSQNLIAAPPCAYVDTKGIAYEEAPQSSGRLLLVIIRDEALPPVPSRVLDEHTLAVMTSILQRAGDQGIGISGFSLLARVPSEIRARAKEGFIITLMKEDDMASAFQVIKTVLDKEIKERRDELDYIDARFGNKVFYKFKE